MGINKYPLLEELVPLQLNVVFSFGIHVHKPESVLDEILFDDWIEWGIGGEAGSMIHLDKGRFEFVIEEDIETQYFEAHVVSIIVRLAGPVVVAQVGLYGADSLDDDSVDIVP